MGWKPDAQGVLHWEYDDPISVAAVSGRGRPDDRWEDKDQSDEGGGNDNGGDNGDSGDSGDSGGNDNGDSGGDNGGGDKGDSGDNGNDKGNNGGEASGGTGFDSGQSSQPRDNWFATQQQDIDNQIQSNFRQNQQSFNQDFLQNQDDFSSGRGESRASTMTMPKLQTQDNPNTGLDDFERQQHDLFTWFKENGTPLVGNEDNNIGANAASGVGEALSTGTTPMNPYQFTADPNQTATTGLTPTTSNGSIFSTASPDQPYTTIPTDANGQPQFNIDDPDQRHLAAALGTNTLNDPAPEPEQAFTANEPSPQTVTPPEATTNPGAMAAATTRAAGGTPAQAAAAAAMAASMVAMDHQTLDQQTSWTRQVFHSTYGDRADEEWVKQHNDELQRNKGLYGYTEPRAGTAPVAGAPAGTPVAPNRTIGAVRPPGPDETARYGSEPRPMARPAAAAAAPQPSAAVTPPAAAPPAAPPPVSTGPVASVTNPTPTSPSPYPAADEFGQKPGQGGATATAATPTKVSPYPAADEFGQAPIRNPAPEPTSFAPRPPATVPTPTTYPAADEFGQVPARTIPTPSDYPAADEFGQVPARPVVTPPPSDELDLPTVNTPQGVGVNSSPLTIAANLALAPNGTQAGEQPTPQPQVDETIKQLVQLLSDPVPNGVTNAAQDAALLPIANIAWYRSVGGQQGPPEAAPREWARSWIQQFKNGDAAAIPLGRQLEAEIKQRGGTPPSERQVAQGNFPTGSRASNIVTMTQAEALPNQEPGSLPSTAPADSSRVQSPGPGDALLGNRAAPPAPDRVQTALDTTVPIDTIAQLAAGPNADPNKVKSDQINIINGIGAMIRGDVGQDGKPTGAWAEPYLNDVARLAWAREERGNGRISDPRDAPDNYIENWKDAFFGGGKGGDESVPFVKELNQQMIDYAVDRTPKGQPFNWQIAYGKDGERGLISHQSTGIDCGPNAFSTMLRSRGYNADPAQTFTYARQTGYHNGSEFTGPENYARMLRDEAGLDAKTQPMNWGAVDKELSEGRPVTLSSPGHYWVVSGVREGPNGKEYYAGDTSSMQGVNNSKDGWTKPGAFQYGGAPTVLITAQGDVDPNSRAVRQLNLKPPVGSTGAAGRMNLSPSQYQTPTQRMSDSINASSTARMQDTNGSDGGTTVPAAGAAVNDQPSERANLKPNFNVDETMNMRDRILHEAPQIQFSPGDDLDTRIRKAAPTLQWIEREYGVPAEDLAGMMMNESRMGLADSPASRANNHLSLTYIPGSDSQATGYAPGQGSDPRWAAYPSVNSMLARFTGMYAHPENGHQVVWRNRFSPDGFLDGLVKDRYIVDEPGKGNSIREWRQQVDAHRAHYRQVIGR